MKYITDTAASTVMRARYSIPSAHTALSGPAAMSGSHVSSGSGISRTACVRREMRATNGGSNELSQMLPSGPMIIRPFTRLGLGTGVAVRPSGDIRPRAASATVNQSFLSGPVTICPGPTACGDEDAGNSSICPQFLSCEPCCLQLQTAAFPKIRQGAGVESKVW